jgi:hypothetical protein
VDLVVQEDNMEDIEKVLKDINKSIKLGSIKLGVAYEDIEKTAEFIIQEIILPQTTK